MSVNTGALYDASTSGAGAHICCGFYPFPPEELGEFSLLRVAFLPSWNSGIPSCQPEVTVARFPKRKLKSTAVK